MGLTRHAVNLFSTANIGSLNQCNIADFSQEYPSAKRWLNTLGLMVIFNNHLSIEKRPLALQFIRRVDMAIEEYRVFRDEVLQHIAGEPSWSHYYRGLHHAEMAMTLLYQAFDIMRKAADESLFDKDDGSAMQRLNFTYNASKHEVPELKDTVWITNQGIQTDKHLLTYAELEDIFRSAGRIVEKILQLQPAPEAGATVVCAPI
jgi:hypothetical protein